MTPRVQSGLQVALSIVAGFVDATAFLSLNQVNVGYMSGNSITLGLAAGGHVDAMWRVVAALVPCFVAGVVAGTLLGGRMARLRPVGVLLLGTVLLAAAGVLEGRGAKVAGVLFMAVALGAVNTVFARPGAVTPGLTYMTGTLVRIGQHLSAALGGGGSWTRLVPDLLLWAGLVAGAGLGALAFRHMAESGLWLGVGACLGIAAVARSALRGEQPVGA